MHNILLPPGIEDLISHNTFRWLKSDQSVKIDLRVEDIIKKEKDGNSIYNNSNIYAD